jgi:uncharacterized small protein (DUF1192 family)
VLNLRQLTERLAALEAELERLRKRVGALSRKAAARDDG